MQGVPCLVVVLLIAVSPFSPSAASAAVPAPARTASPETAGQRELAQSSLEEGRTLFEDMFDQKARSAFEKAEALALAAGWEEGAMQARVGQARVHRRQGRTRQAMDLYREALAWYEKAGDQSRIAESHGYIADLLAETGRPAEAREMREKVLSMREARGSRAELAAALAALARSCTHIDDDKAVRLLERSRALVDESDEPDRRASVKRTLAAAYLELARMDDAIVLLSEARDGYERLGRPLPAASCDLGLAGLYKSSGMDAEALSLAKRSLSTFRKAGCRYGEAKARGTIVDVSYRYTEPVRAVAEYERLLAILEGIEDLRAAANTSLIVGLMSEYVIKYGQISPKERPSWEAKSLHYLAQAQRLSEEIEDPDVSWCHIGIGHLYMNLNQPEKAIAPFRRGREILERFPVGDSLLKAWASEGGALRAAGHRIEAREAYSKALAIIERIRREVRDPARGSFGAGELAWVPAAMARMSVEDGDARTAFGFIELSKGNIVRQALTSRPGAPADALSPEDAERLRTLRDNHHAAETALATLNASLATRPQAKEAFLEAQSARDRAVTELTTFEAVLSARSPRWARMAARPASLEQVARRLGPDMAILNFVTESHDTSVVVLRNVNGEPRLTGHVIAPDIKLAWRLVEDFAQALKQDRRRGKDSALILARKLYDLVFSPLEGDLDGIRSLVVCPDGYLHTLPFAALMDGNGKFLIERFAISFAPSASAWEACRTLSEERSAVPSAPPVVAAVSRFAARPKLVASLPPGTVRRDGSMADLPHAKDEAAMVSKALGPDTTVLSDEEATVEQVLARAENARFLHVATHAVPNDAIPLQSALVLAQSEGNPLGLLRAQDIYNLRLNAEMAVLSACSTSSGKVTGEGLMGLSWAFLVAGCPRTVASRWDVDDRATRRWMEAFYSAYAGEKKGAAEAVRQAALSLLRTKGTKEDDSSPYHWAAWTLIGNDR